MTVMEKSFDHTARGVVLSKRRDDLRSIRGPACAAVFWQRDVPPTFRAWIDSLAPQALPRGRVTVARDGVHNAMAQLCAAAGIASRPECDWLIDDVAKLAEGFAGVMKAPHLRLRVDVVTTNACRKFHVDAILARLICTYRGVGTQYGISEDGDDPGQIHTVPTGSPIVLRGSLWPETPRSGLLHRSPPIEGTGETRLVLVLDPIYDPGEEA